jgi:hypothetical protein
VGNQTSFLKPNTEKIKLTFPLSQELLVLNIRLKALKFLGYYQNIANMKNDTIGKKDWTMKLHQRFKINLIGLILTFSVLTIFPVSVMAYRFESATLGETGLTDIGYTVGAFQFVGVRFQINKPIIATSIGGHFFKFKYSDSGDIFAAVVKLDSFSDFPDSDDLTTSDVLAYTIIQTPEYSDLISGPISLTLEPGVYGLIFGAGLFGTNGAAGAPYNGIAYPPNSYFYWQNGYRDGGISGSYFFLEGTEIEIGNYNFSNISTLSDEFQLWIDISIDGQVLTTICQNYDFFVKQNDQIVTSNIECQYLENQQTEIDNSGRYRIWFKLNPDSNNQRATYFEDGKIYMCEKDDPFACTVFNGLSDFSVYGTTFDITKHAWQFRNGDWNKPTGFGPSGFFWSDDIYKSANIIEDYLPENRREDFWESMGKWLTTKGGCYGLVNSAISNFTHMENAQPWGTGTIANWRIEIESNWDNVNNYTIPPYKPFTTNNIYSNRETFDIDNGWTTQSAKKIMYHFVSQPHFSEEHDYWTGEDISYYFTKPSGVDILKGGSPISLGIKGFDNGEGWGHRVAITQSIFWNGHEKHIIWDNNYPYPEKKNGYGPYLEWYVENSQQYEPARHINYINENDGNGWHWPSGPKYQMSDIPSLVFKGNNDDWREEDSQNIYNRWQDTNVQAMALEYSPFNLLSNELQYESYHHIEVLMVGAKVEDIINNQSGLPVPLIPYGAIQPERSVIKKTAGGFFSTVYLPVDHQYIVNAKIVSQSPGTKVFVTIPNSDGTVEKINYENVGVNINEDIEINFIVGRDNSDKSIKRTVNGISIDVYPFDYSGTHPNKIGAPENVQAFFENNMVNVLWTNTDHSNLSTITVVRKETGYPLTSDDGTVIFNGFSEYTTDTSVSANSTYYYSVFSHDANGGISDPAHAIVKTDAFCIFGLIGTGESGLKSTKIILSDDQGRILDSYTTGENGQYLFPNLESGNYNIEASHPSYSIQDPIRSISIIDYNIQQDFTADPIPTVELLFDLSELKVGHQAFIQWAYRNLDNDNSVDLSINRGSSWETIGSNIPIIDGQFIWSIDGPETDNAVLKISLNGNLSVFDEHIVNIKQIPCNGDFEPDGDVDGADLSAYLVNPMEISLADFSASFGRTDCP